MQPTEIAAAAGQAPGLLWAAPFFGVLASIAVLPIVAPRLWHRRQAWMAGFWIAALLAPQVAVFGPTATAETAWRAILLDYLPFVTMLLSLYAAGGGVLIRGGATGTPAGNTLMLAGGVVCGVVMGQAGAAIVVINPLLRANAHRTRKTHLALFVIVLVANASGALTPLGNPPLYVGFLQGVPFFWTTHHLLTAWLVLNGIMLTAFYTIDRVLAARDPPAPAPGRLQVRGWGNVALILAVGAMVLVQNRVPAGTVRVLGAPVDVMRLIAPLVFMAASVASAALTPRAVRQANDFTWTPMIEVAQLFLAIFVTITPVLTMLEAGVHGPFAPLVGLTRDAAGHARPAAIFWLAGILSAFLDNAPTYLVFFKLAGIHPPSIVGQHALALAALSAGAVFFGALTYIGNAANLIVRGIAAHRGVRMPGFLGYAALASMLLIPVFLIQTLIFF